MAPCVPPPQGLKAPHLRQGGARHLLQSFMHPVAPPQHGVSADDLAEPGFFGGVVLDKAAAARALHKETFTGRFDILPPPAPPLPRDPRAPAPAVLRFRCASGPPPRAPAARAALRPVLQIKCAPVGWARLVEIRRLFGGWREC
jgi:hypothetical protein